MLSSYCLRDPPVCRESPITPETIRLIHKTAKSPHDKFISSLITGAFFYAMQSCEYSKTTGELKTQIITTNNISFLERKTIVSFLLMLTIHQLLQFRLFLKFKRISNYKNQYQIIRLIAIFVQSVLGSILFIHSNCWILDITLIYNMRKVWENEFTLVSAMEMRFNT